MSVLDFTLRLSGKESLSSTGKKAAAGLKKVTGESAQLLNAQKKLGGLQTDIAKFKALKRQASTTAASLQKAQAETAGLAKEMKQAERPTSALTRKFNQKIAATRHLKNVHKAETEQLERLRRGLSQSGISTRDLARHTADLTRKGQALNRQLEERTRIEQQRTRLNERSQLADDRLLRTSSIAGNITFIGDATTRTADTMRRGLNGVTGAAITFESAMADVRKVVDFKDEDGLARLGRDLRRMSAKEIPITASGLAQIAASGGQMGVAEENLLSFTRTAAKMSIAFDVMPEEAGEAMATLSNVTGIPINDIEALGDAINHLSDNMPAKARQITQGLLRSGGTGRLFGLDPRETAALNASLISMGKRPEVAATGINAMLIRMQAATKQTPAFTDALAQMGLSAEQLEQDIAVDAQGALLSFLEALEGFEGSERVGLLSDLFGMEYADDISLLVGSLDVYRDALGEVSDTERVAGSMQREFANRSATTANRMQLYRNSLQELKMVLGETLLPQLTAFAVKAGNVVRGISEWAEANPKLAGGLMTVALGATALMTIAGPLMTLIASGVGTWAMYRFATEKASIALARNALASGAAKGGLFGLAKRALPMAIAGVRGLSLALLTNPIGLIVGGIALGGLLLIKYWKPVSAFFKGLFKGLMDGLGPLGSVLQSAFQPLGTVFGWIGSGIKAVAGWLGRLFGPVKTTEAGLTRMSNAGVSAGRMIAGAINLILTPLRLVFDLASRVWSGLKAVLSWSPVKTVRKAWGGLTKVVGDLLLAPVRAVQNGWGMIKTIVSWSPVGLVGKAWRGLRAIFSWSPVKTIRNAWNGLTKSVGDLLLAPIRAVQNGWGTIKKIVAWSPVGLVGKAWRGVGGLLGRITGRSADGVGMNWARLHRIMGWMPHSTLKKAWAGLGDLLKGPLSRMLDQARGAMSKLTGILAKPLGKLQKALGLDGKKGKGLLAGLALGIAGPAGPALAGAITKPAVTVDETGDDKRPPDEPPFDPAGGPPPSLPPQSVPYPFDLPNAVAPEAYDWDDANISVDVPDMPDMKAGDTYGDIHIKIEGAGQDARAIADEVMRRLEARKGGAHFDVE